LQGFLSFLPDHSHNPYKREDNRMQYPLKTAAALGKVVRATRKAQGIRQDDAAGSIGVSENFLGKVERGEESVQWGKLFAVLHGLGIQVSVDVPAEIAAKLVDDMATRERP
jgi:transcriptional regulator with XRE-family HTH domain